MPVNDLIFKELIKRGYSLEGKTRVWNIADSKLWYLTPDQSQSYLELDSNSNYQKNTGQDQLRKLLNENIKILLDYIGDSQINIVDLGCGDGKKSAELVKKIKEFLPNLKFRYCPIDISSYMVEKAIETFSKFKVDEIIEFQYNISDFENLENVTPLLRKGNYKKNLILLFGNTLGNFEINDFLYAVKGSMNKDDLFLLDISVDDNKNEERAIAHQKNKKFNNWLIHIPLELGLEIDDVEMGVRFKNKRLEFFYEIKKDKKVSFQDKTVYFNRGDQIITMIANKPNLDDLRTFLKIHFDSVTVKVSKDGSKAIAFCEKSS